MTKRPAAVVELENRLHEMLDTNGGLQETRWTGQLVDLMRETENSDGKLYLLKVLLQTELSAPLSRFVQLGGAEVLVKWLTEHSRNSTQLDCLVLHNALNGLNKLNLNSDVTRTELTPLVGALSKFSDPGVAYAAAHLLTRLRNPPEDIKPPVKRAPPPPQYWLSRPEIRAPVYQGPKILRYGNSLNKLKLKMAGPRPARVQQAFLSRRPSNGLVCKHSSPALTRASEYCIAEMKAERAANIKLREGKKRVEQELSTMAPRTPYVLVTISKPKRVRDQTLSLEVEEISKLIGVECLSSELDPQDTTNYSSVPDDIQNVPLNTVTLTQPVKPQYQPATSVSSVPNPMNTTGFLPGMMFPFTNPMFFQPRVPINTHTNKPMNYRTVPCRNFHSPAGCERGDNCHFIHDFGFEGRPISNITDWKKSNEIRQKNLKSMQTLNMGYASYYPPAGPEPHLMDARKPS